MRPPKPITKDYWGLYSNAAQKGVYVKWREFLGQEVWESKKEPQDWQSVPERCFPEDSTQSWFCPVCGKRLNAKAFSILSL